MSTEWLAEYWHLHTAKTRAIYKDDFKEIFIDLML